MKIEEIIEQIVEKCKKQMSCGEWGKNDAMRYAYIELGKHISKSSRFFFSLEGKYGDAGLSVEEMRNIHYADSSKEVTCYVTAKMLKTIFTQLGIESHILQSVQPRIYEGDGETLKIYHSYLVGTGDDDKKYFMSLNSDLVNIKFNFKPEHFADAVPYYYNGYQTYIGDEIDFSTLSPKELLEIDSRIGYAFLAEDYQDEKLKYIYASSDYSHDVFGRQLKQAENYLNSQLEKIDERFLKKYNDLIWSFKFSNGKTKDKFTDFSKEETREIQKFIFFKCLNLIDEKYGAKNHFANVNEFEKFFDEDEIDRAGWKKDVNNLINKHIKENLDNSLFSKDDFHNPFKTMHFAVNLVSYVENVSNPEFGKKLSQKEKFMRRKFYDECLKNISKQFVPKEILEKYLGDKNPSNLFLVEKIKNYVVRDFECETSAECEYLPEFCYRFGTVEQATYLKKYLRTILKPELPDEKDFLSRIMFSAVASYRNSNEYAFLIHIKGNEKDKTEPVYSLLYDPKTNQLTKTSFLDLRMKYKILSKTVMNQLQGKASDINEIEEADNFLDLEEEEK